LKSLADAVGIRNKILSAFEQAEAEGRCRSSPRFVDVRFGWRRTNRRRDGGGARYFRSDVITFRIPPARSNFSTNCFD
jgi:hypothetical protein